MTPRYPEPAANRAELIDHIREARASLESLISPLTVDQCLTPLGDWSIRDHLAHLGAWLGKAIALIQDEPAYRGLGLSAPPADPRDYDSINAILHDRDQSLALEEVVARWNERDASIQAALMLASDRELRRPMPPDEPDGRSLLAAVANNTYEHYIEHEFTIREGLDRLRP
jgi:hypothetical protein